MFWNHYQKSTINIFHSVLSSKVQILHSFILTRLSETLYLAPALPNCHSICMKTAKQSNLRRIINTLQFVNHTEIWQGRAYPNQKWKHKLLCRRYHVSITAYQCPMLSDINFSQSHIATKSLRHSSQYPGHFIGTSAYKGSLPSPSRWSRRNPEPWHGLFIRESVGPIHGGGVGGPYGE